MTEQSGSICDDKKANSVFVEENFYPNPMILRDRVLGLNFDVHGPFPGSRTRAIWQLGWPDYSDGGNALKSKFESVISERIVAWPANSSNGSFQICKADDKPSIHTDPCWVAVVYLTPNANLHSGTSFFEREYVRPKAECHIDNAQHIVKWKKYMEIDNVFNRALIFRGSLFHRQTAVFGADMSKARLSQVFFFGTESCGARLCKSV